MSLQRTPLLLSSHGLLRELCVRHSCMTFLSLSRFVFRISFLFFTSRTFVVFLNWLKNTCLSSAIMATALRPSLNSIHCTRATRKPYTKSTHTHLCYFFSSSSARKINCCRLACCIVPRITQTRAKYVEKKKKNRWEIVPTIFVSSAATECSVLSAAFAFTTTFFCSTFCWPSGKWVCFS